MGFFDLFDAVNVIDRVEGFVASIWYANWKGSKHTKSKGVVGELTNSLVGGNSWSFKVSREDDWSGADIEAFLRHYGVVVWGRRITDKHFHFTVKRRQANWAEYLLRRRGIQVESASFNEKNIEYAARHAPGDAPPAWADRQVTRKSVWAWLMGK